MEFTVFFFFFFFFILTLVPFLAESIHFQLESGAIKCIGEDIRSNSMTVGNYSVVNHNQGYPLPSHHKINVSVYTPKGERPHHAEVVESGQFTFEIEEEGNYFACISALEHQPRENISVEFDWRSGVSTKRWSNVAKKGSIDAMEIELMKMADTIANIDREMFDLRVRNLEMLIINSNTNARMGYLSLVSLLVCLSVAALQQWHLKSFFQKKKII